MRLAAFIALVWSVAVLVHILWEAWILATRGYLELPVCRRWWCPHGLWNRFHDDDEEDW